MKADVVHGLGFGLECGFESRCPTCNGAEEVFSQAAAGLPAFETDGGLEVAFHVELSANERGCRGIDIGGQQRLKGLPGGDTEGKTGGSLTEALLSPIVKPDAPDRRAGRRRMFPRSVGLE
ncbi:MAG: hypothetical protein WCB12_02120 [Bryobacteraceae bacterium]